MIRRRTWRAGPGPALALALLVLVVPGCATKQKKVANTGFMSAEAQYRQGMEYLAASKLNLSRTTLQRIQYGVDDDRARIEPLARMALADATFYQWNDLSWIDARNLYMDFVTLFGDHQRAPYAQFQTGVCSLLQAANPSRDQTQTLQAIRDLGSVERRYPASAFADAARRMKQVAEAHLAEHEFLVGKFYFKKKIYGAAADRFRNVLETYPHYHELDKIYFFMGKALLRNDSDVEARIYLDKLVTDYPEGQYIAQARKLLAEAGGGLSLDAEATP